MNQFERKKFNLIIAFNKIQQNSLKFIRFAECKSFRNFENLEILKKKAKAHVRVAKYL